MEPVDSKSTTQTVEQTFPPTEVPVSFSMALDGRLARTKAALSERPDDKNLQNYLEIYTNAKDSLISGKDSKELRKAITIQQVLLVTDLIRTMNKNKEAAATGFEITPTDKLDKELQELKDFESRLSSQQTSK